MQPDGREQAVQGDPISFHGYRLPANCFEIIAKWAAAERRAHPGIVQFNAGDPAEIRDQVTVESRRSRIRQSCLNSIKTTPRVLAHCCDGGSTCKQANSSHCNKCVAGFLPLSLTVRSVCGWLPPHIKHRRID